MTYDEAKKAAVENGRLVRRRAWQHTRVGYDRVRETFFHQEKDNESKFPYRPSLADRAAVDWEYA